MATRASGLIKLVGLCGTAGVLVAAVLFPIAGGLGLASNRAADTVDQTSGELAEGQLPLMTTIEDKDGNPIAYLYKQYRIPVKSDQISAAMKNAIVAVEDERFYSHHGVDWQGVARAAAQAGVEGEVSGGGSSLTQQYVKNYLAYVIGDGTEEGYAKATEVSLGRKLKEARIALQLEQKMSKDEILTAYLNIVPYGSRTYGVGAAARTYFNTTPDKLTVPQAALLAGLVNRPSALSKSPEDALERRNTVIDRMLRNNMFGDSNSDQAKKAAEEYKAAPLGVVSPLNVPASDCVGAGDGEVDGFFCSYLQEYLAKAGLSKDELKRGGYTVRTTLDRKATDAAKRAAEEEVPKTTKGIANVMSIVEPGTDKHRVRALVANRDYGPDADAGQTSYDLPSEVTNFGAGSIYKVFTAAAALEKHVTGINQMIPTPSFYTSQMFKGGGPNCQSAGRGERFYCLKNASEGGPEERTLTNALATSPNTGFVILEEWLGGVAPVVDMAVRLGMRESMQGVNRQGQTLKADGSNGPSQGDQFKQENAGSFTLGVGPTSVLELANVSATLMSGGTWCPPSPVEQVLDRNGKPVQLNEQPCEQVVDPALANTLVVGMSQDDKPGGTSARAAQETGWDPNRPIMGKTGTTNDHMSVGFIGATPQYAGAVLTFSDGVSPQVICRGNPPRLCGKNGSPGVYGGDVAAPTWFKAMKVIHEGKEIKQLPAPDPRYQ
ncbi:transglycosylase domain-containing protein [Goodfellowiella coeruleoviolacea]|uniref:Membrane carboxypeptidase (Penicillin-binding protein) n=1 Tax=Goodfellowiella coeruleoviolacea TaxID=334858 RepID=A0AAE3KJB6_9PSEU|nr:transglycosylase domain-containing protein [Goodfellowiella coeruleoviolacea]MCP2169445.1 Membrane carboxypeptidase (penicillin-binding protein) [Goodfellowiella coeruleoviolacea]